MILDLLQNSITIDVDGQESDNEDTDTIALIGDENKDCSIGGDFEDSDGNDSKDDSANKTKPSYN